MVTQSKGLDCTLYYGALVIKCHDVDILSYYSIHINCKINDNNNNIDFIIIIIITLGVSFIFNSGG